MAITRRAQDRCYLPRLETVVLAQAEFGERWGNLAAQLPVLKPDFLNGHVHGRTPSSKRFKTSSVSATASVAPSSPICL